MGAAIDPVLVGSHDYFGSCHFRRWSMETGGVSPNWDVSEAVPENEDISQSASASEHNDVGTGRLMRSSSMPCAP